MYFDSNVVDNEIEGSIPTEIGTMRSMNAMFLGKLFVVRLAIISTRHRPNPISLVLRCWTDMNQLSGSIPSELGVLDGLYELLLRKFNCPSSSSRIQLVFYAFLSQLALNRRFRKQQTKWILTDSTRSTGEAKGNSFRYELPCFVHDDL